MRIKFLMQWLSIAFIQIPYGVIILRMAIS